MIIFHLTSYHLYVQVMFGYIKEQWGILGTDFFKAVKYSLVQIMSPEF